MVDANPNQGQEDFWSKKPGLTWSENDGIMDSTVSMSYEGRLRPQEKQSEDWIEAQWGKASRAIAAINNRWMSHLAGPLHIGQIGVACALSYVDLRHDDRGWRNGNAALAEWHKDFAARDSMKATKVDG